MNRNALSSVFAVIVAGGLAGGCVAAPDEEIQSRTQALSGEDVTPDSPDCDYLPGCSLDFVGGITDPLQSQLRCTQSYLYRNGAVAGYTGGVGSFCPDSVANRLALHAAGARGYLPGYCSTCLNVPLGKLFVLWSESVGPGCPSSCSTQSPAPAF